MNNFSLDYFKKYILIIITILAISCGKEPDSLFERYSEETGDIEQDFIHYTVNKISDILKSLPLASNALFTKEKSPICEKAGAKNSPMRMPGLVYGKQTPWIVNEELNQNAKKLAELVATGYGLDPKGKIPANFLPKPENGKTGAWISKEMKINDNEMNKFLCEKMGGNGKEFGPDNTGRADLKGGKDPILAGALTATEKGPDLQVGIGRYQVPGNENKYYVAIYFHGTNSRNESLLPVAKAAYAVVDTFSSLLNWL